MEKSGFKKFWDNFWFIVWKDESFKGWIISIIFIFIVIKFVFFPVLSLTTGTKLPLAIIESCSMYHQGNLFSDYDSWWTRHETKYSDFQLDKKNFKKFIFNNGFSKGDILFMVKAKPEKLKVGDVIIFEGNLQNPIIHRVIKIEKENEEYIFSTIGDNNNGQLSLEKEIKSNQLIGKSAFRITPWLGWAKLVLYEPMRSEAERGFCDER
ncbi:MAG TPA: signal peptidase I [Candidatus Nanoarchaeia archaeon]|nr:signal peptidase I [Candidatus Nanoarchaeia archaeon]